MGHEINEMLDNETYQAEHAALQGRTLTADERGKVAEAVKKAAADGLLSPQIKKLERLTRQCEGKLP